MELVEALDRQLNPNEAEEAAIDRGASISDIKRVNLKKKIKRPKKSDADKTAEALLK